MRKKTLFVIIFFVLGIALLAGAAFLFGTASGMELTKKLFNKDKGGNSDATPTPIVYINEIVSLVEGADAALAPTKYYTYGEGTEQIIIPYRVITRIPRHDGVPDKYLTSMNEELTHSYITMVDAEQHTGIYQVLKSANTTYYIMDSYDVEDTHVVYVFTSDDWNLYCSLEKLKPEAVLPQ